MRKKVTFVTHSGSFMAVESRKGISRDLNVVAKRGCEFSANTLAPDRIDFQQLLKSREISRRHEREGEEGGREREPARNDRPKFHLFRNFLHKYDSPNKRMTKTT